LFAGRALRAKEHTQYIERLLTDFMALK
jgi:hypothetical protein